MHRVHSTSAQRGSGHQQAKFCGLTFVVDATRRWHPELMMPGGPIAHPCVKAKGYRNLSEALISFRSRGQHMLPALGSTPEACQNFWEIL